MTECEDEDMDLERMEKAESLGGRVPGSLDFPGDTMLKLIGEEWDTSSQSLTGYTAAYETEYE